MYLPPVKNELLGMSSLVHTRPYMMYGLVGVVIYNARTVVIHNIAQVGAPIHISPINRR